jgi:hypothetical protein
MNFSDNLVLNKLIFKELQKIKAIFTGICYQYLIEADLSSGMFEIYAKHIKTDRVSPITNLNQIISEFSQYCADEDETDDSTWVIKDSDRLKDLCDAANVYFADTKGIDFLEEKLDEDRNEGGWDTEVMVFKTIIPVIG